MAGSIKTVTLVKTPSGFGFTLGHTPLGQMVRLATEPNGRVQLRPGDIIVAIDGFNVSRETHEKVVSILKSYQPGSSARISFIRTSTNDCVTRIPLRSRSAVPPHGGPMYNKNNTIEEDSVSSFNTGINSTSSSVTGHQTTTPSRDQSWNGAASSSTYNAPPLPPPPPPPLPTSTSHHRHRRHPGLHRVVSTSRSTPINEVQKQYRMMRLDSVSSSTSSNFSGTPDFIPASLYLPSSSTRTNNNSRPQERQLQQTSDRTSTINRDGYHNTRTMNGHGYHTPTGAPSVSRRSKLNEKVSSVWNRGGGGGDGGEWGGGGGGGEEEVPQSHKMQSVETQGFGRTSSVMDELLDSKISAQQLHRTPPNGSCFDNGKNGTLGQSSTHREENYSKKHETETKRDDELNDEEQRRRVYEVAIHRGSRGFGFSIRGGNEFNGMSLFVLDIANGGPADMDGRMKNGDQILSINDVSTKGMTHKTAIQLIQNACSPISLVIKRTSLATDKLHSKTFKGGTYQSGKPSVKYLYHSQHVLS